MTRALQIIVCAAACLFAPNQPRAALDLSRPSEPQPIIIAGKILVYPGAHVVLRNVNFGSLPVITVQANSTVVIDGSAAAGAPAIRW
jgi:hypothetical protein